MAVVAGNNHDPVVDFLHQVIAQPEFIGIDHAAKLGRGRDQE
jgi:hypothetical protein